MSDLPSPRRVRADAARNREQILRATVDLLVEDGPTVALEKIARRAGVGIATLYRHFADRSVLLRQVTIDMWRQSAAVLDRALAEEPDAFTALGSFLHAAIDLRMGVILPMLSRLAEDEELFAARDEAKRALEALVRAAHEEQSLRPDIGTGDISLLVVRVARPLPLPITPEANRKVSHRHAELILGGLLRFLAVDSLPGRTINAVEEMAGYGDDEESVRVAPGGYQQDGGDGTAVRPEPAADTEGRSTTSDS
jgi:AcrR family transcriptional regulator